MFHPDQQKGQEKVYDFSKLPPLLSPSHKRKKLSWHLIKQDPQVIKSECQENQETQCKLNTKAIPPMYFQEGS